ncbi:MAG: YitT family protein [Oscillospiraceae bacterium]|nr:YitT family protein [Oscillospiraceae bacterium]
MKRKSTLRQHAETFGSILAGGVIIAIAIQIFLVPNQLVTGGISGIAIIINHFTGWPVGVLFFAINAVMFAIALKPLGWVFILTAFVGIVTTSVLVDVLALFEFVLTENLLIVAASSGALIGAGIALIFRVGSSTGGIDIASRLIMRKRPDLTLGHLILIFDGAIIIAGAVVFRQVDLALYAIVSVYILKRVVDAILYRKKEETECSK